MTITPEGAWSILYRGPLSSCNYACDYCPFAKTKNTREELRIDAEKLQRFVDWVEAHPHRSIGLLFTPWGEALIRRSYQEALTRLSHMSHVRRVAIQTNLSGELGWTERVDKSKLALWTTFHPTQIDMERFLARCQELDQRQIKYSVGVVGFKDAIEALEQLRQRLSPEVYLWINAYKRDPQYYDEETVQRLERVDPLFRYNTRYHESEGLPCRAGHTTFSVDGEGQATRCHFIKAPIGNIYEPDFEARLAPTPCSTQRCGCHIGYVHMPHLKLYEAFEGGELERIAPAPTWGEGAEQVRRRALEQLGPHHPSSR